MLCFLVCVCVLFSILIGVVLCIDLFCVRGFGLYGVYVLLSVFVLFCVCRFV